MVIEHENPVPRPGSAGLNGEGKQQFEYMASEMEDEDVYLRDLAGVDSLEEASCLKIIVNTSVSTINHLSAKLPNLEELNLSGSILESIRDLGTGFRNVQVLWVSRCSLTGFAGISALPALRELYASFNDISELQPLDGCGELEVLDVEGNCIQEPDDVYCLAHACPKLQSLTLSGNPLSSHAGYQLLICQAIPGLQLLDDEPVASFGNGDMGSSPRATSVTEHEDDKASGSAGQGPISTGGHDPAERTLVTEGIKHARLGIDSHEFRELEMSLMMTADALPSDTRPTTSAMMLPVSAGSWLRCSQHNSFSGSNQRSPISSASDHPAGSSGAGATAHRTGSAGSSRLGSCGSASGGSALQQRISTARPFSSRPGTGSFVPRPGSGAAGSAPPSAASGGLYWKKNRLGSGSAATASSGHGILAEAAHLGDAEDAAASSSLTFGATQGMSMSGSMARDLRNRKKAVASGGPPGSGSVASSGGGAARPLSADTGLANGLGVGASGRSSSAMGAHDSLRGSQQIDSSLLLQELCRWKMATADKALLPSEDEMAGGASAPWGSGIGAETDALVGTVDRIDLAEASSSNVMEEAVPSGADVLQLSDAPSEPLDGMYVPLQEHVPDAATRSAACHRSASLRDAGGARPTSPSVSRSASYREDGKPPLAVKPPTVNASHHSPARKEVHGLSAAGLPVTCPVMHPRGPSKMMLHKVLRDQQIETVDSAASSPRFLKPVRPPSRSSIEEGHNALGADSGSLRRVLSGSKEIELRHVNPQPVCRQDEPDSDDDLFAGLDDD